MYVESTGKKNFSKIIAYPNPFVGETEIQIINFEGVYDVSIIDIQGKIIFKLNNLEFIKIGEGLS